MSTSPVVQRHFFENVAGGMPVFTHEGVEHVVSCEFMIHAPSEEAVKSALERTIVDAIASCNGTGPIHVYTSDRGAPHDMDAFVLTLPEDNELRRDYAKHCEMYVGGKVGFNYTAALVIVQDGVFHEFSEPTNLMVSKSSVET